MQSRLGPSRAARCHERFITAFHAARLPKSIVAVPARKTERARLALTHHGADLDLRQRRTLILCDGHRSNSELTRMLGPDTVPLLQRLQDAGYLEGVDAATASVVADDGNAASTPNRTTPHAASGRRRSLSAARIYVQGMLDLQHAPAAQALRAQLVGSGDEAATVAAILMAIEQLPAFTKAGYASRVRDRVAEVLPEQHLPALAALSLGNGVDAVA